MQELSHVRCHHLKDLYTCPDCGAMFVVGRRRGKGRALSLKPFDGLVAGIQIFDEDLVVFTTEYSTMCFCEIAPVRVGNKDQLVDAKLTCEIKSMRLMD